MNDSVVLRANRDRGYQKEGFPQFMVFYFT